MNKTFLAILATFIASFSFGQSTENQKLIELGKAYKNFMFRNEPPKGFVTDLQNNVPENLKPASDFIVQTISTDNDLLKEKYLTLPDNATLKFIYIAEAINSNVRKEMPTDNYTLADSLKQAGIPQNELVDNYYSMLFAAAGNKIKPFNFSKIDFKLNSYNLANDTEKGIFFLQCMRYCGSEIWGYMNIVKPANTKKAYDYILKFPKFNGLNYYQFTDLNFPDFEMLIVEDQGKQSYKSYYIDKFYDLLLSHLICLNKENPKDKDIKDLLLGSILKDRIFYKYTKNKETLESIFKEQKQD
ncbi:hypothetical protein [Ferruginibacter sp. SUN106]|uniref:hypothetical protein n=1 Tax=Ferruginibacter sp. SUN106 TaxID=2978348 RepID=UPI003D36E5FC